MPGVSQHLRAHVLGRPTEAVGPLTLPHASLGQSKVG
jgi:hypothetical protein